MMLAYRLLGLVAVALALIGIALPVLPTVPFLLLAAFFFARSNPEWERRIVEHPRFGQSIRDWRERRAIGRKAKAAAIAALAASGALGLTLLELPWLFVPAGVALITGTWIATRPS
jgi:uncharacterized membrane protein YbaN (DUF454 family)